MKLYASKNLKIETLSQLWILAESAFPYITKIEFENDEVFINL